MNIVSLREYIEERFVAEEKAQKLLQAALDFRLEEMNNFRNDLRMQAAGFMTRKEVEIQIERIQEDIRFLRESRATLEGKASNTSVFVTGIISLVGIFLSVFSILIRSKAHA